MMDKDAIAKDEKYISSVIQENSEFLLENIKDGYSEVVDLIQDAWDFDILFIKKRIGTIITLNSQWYILGLIFYFH